MGALTNYDYIETSESTIYLRKYFTPILFIDKKYLCVYIYPFVFIHKVLPRRSDGVFTFSYSIV